MITVKRSIKLNVKLNTSVFEILNKDAFGIDTRLIGSHIGAVNDLGARTEFMRMIMPQILGKGYEDSNWQESVTDYLHEFHLEVPTFGKRFDIGYTFDISNPDYKEYIEDLITLSKVKKELSTKEKEEFLVEYIKKHISEEDLYKYVTFINKEEYIQYRYILLHNVVANSVGDINKSNKIRFYLSSEEDEKEAREARVKKNKNALAYANELISKGTKDDIDNIIIAYKFVGNHVAFSEMSEDEKLDIIIELAKNDPERLINIRADKMVDKKAMIQKYLWVGLLKQLSGSDTIVDGVKPDIVLGNGFSEAISYLSNESNAQYANELLIKYKSQTK